MTELAVREKPELVRLDTEQIKFRDVLARFWGHVDIRGEVDCWLWQAIRYHDGYGGFQIRPGVKVRAHRFALETAQMAPIPAGYLALHSCDTKACVNPCHLRVGTQSENLRDCIARGRHPNSNRTHCRHGHEYDEANTRWDPRGHRRCRACDRDWHRVKAAG